MEAARSSETIPILCENTSVTFEKTVNIIFFKSFSEFMFSVGSQGMGVC
jgi:hypothetical protein